MNWLRFKWAWAKANHLFWANLALILISGLLIFVWPGPEMPTGPSDLRLRTWGMALQLIGILTVWFDLTSTARRFGKGGFLRNTWVWLKAFFGRSIVMEAKVGTFGFLGTKGRLKTHLQLKPEAPLPDRVTALETNVKKIDEQLDAAYDEIAKLSNEVNAKIAAARGVSDQAIREVRTSLEEAATGNLATLGFGVVWLAIGVVLATLAPEIVKLVGGRWCEVWAAL